MALHLVYRIFSILFIYSYLVHSLNDQVFSSNLSTQQVNYVTPNRSVHCFTDQHPCLTIDEYASQIDWFFLNNSIFKFLPGNHSLNIGLNISGIHNVSFIGLPDNGVTIMVLNRSACISWEDCKNIEITNIYFIIESKFSCVLSFNSVFCVKLSNITILGNSHIGCSSIISQRSAVDINNSRFTGIRGYYGAALTVSRSTITFAENNSFLRNKAVSGGAIFLYDSSVLFKWSNSFCNNSAQKHMESYLEPGNECFSIYNYSVIFEQRNSFSGGGIFSYSSTITIIDNSSEPSSTSEVNFSALRCYSLSDSNYDYIDNQIIEIYKCKCNTRTGEYESPDPSSKLSIKNCNPSLRFYNNVAEQGGGSIISIHSSIKVFGTVDFVRNSARTGGTLLLIETSFCFIGSPCLTGYVHLDNFLQLSSHMLFLNNSATLWGGALFLSNTNFTTYGSISFVNNSAKFGGALYIKNSSILLNVTKHYSQNFTQGVYIMFLDNIAQLRGGAIFLKNSTTMQIYGNVSLIRNYANHSGGTIFLKYSTLQIYGSTSLVENNARTKGGAIYLTKSNIQMCGTVTLAKNKANIGGAVHAEASNITIGVNCSFIHLWLTTIVFMLNMATYSGGAVSSIDSRLYLMGSALFDGNIAGYGGAMILDGTSNLTLKPNLSLSFINNRANQRGGVFYYDHSVSSCDRFKKYYEQRPECFVSFEDISPELKNNFTSKAGSFLYSGKLGICYRYSGKFSIFEECRKTIRENYCSHLKESSLTSAIATEELFSTDTEDVKFCQVQHKFSSRNVTIAVYLGEKFNVSLIGAGTFNLPVNTRIFHKMLFPIDKNIELRRVELLTRVSSLCSNVSYYILVYSMTNQLTVHTKLYHQNPCDSLVDGVNLYIDIKPCPLGFELSHKHKKCVCDKWLQDFGITECNIDNLSIERKKNTFWISKLANNSKLIFHDGRCPFDFCKDNFVNVSLSNPSIQCDFNRNGTLCGQCREQYSLALGTLHCLYCANSCYITLVLPFALAGMALVIVILLLHLTVDVGTLNGLIFYANIVHSNREAYFQHTREITKFHAIFISWLNLDFGIETCFYHGMDIYTYSWLQFVFPFYLWFLIGVIIFICRYSQRLSNSLGRNPVAALATVFFFFFCHIVKF